MTPIGIDQELRSSYLDYSMSVIVGRALPDVRDGLKPVHRRVLYAMLREGLASNRRYSKCAGVVGEVLKKYHPHGDASVYDALVRMAQPWNMRYLLVDGQGNFGSVDGDNAAAYRYTECRMTRAAEELLGDIDEETVNFQPNFDGQTEEPEVLPAAYPNLLVNGAEGIAVGMATKIPPHNLVEVVNAVLALIDNRAITLPELMQFIPGPDFPTGGIIQGRDGIFEAYSTGRGRIVVRAKVEFEEVHNREAIIISELPYQVNKARLQEDIAGLVRDKKVDGIHTIRDESDRRGMRVVIELKHDAVREVVLNHLWKHTQLQSTFGVILLAIVQQRPRVLTLKEMIEFYVAHRREVILRRTRYRLRKATDRAHILEGFRLALDNIDEVIRIIRAAGTVDAAREGLIARFGFSQIQAQAILDMRLQRLTGMEREKIDEEYATLQRDIEWLTSVLKSEAILSGVIKEELIAVRDRLGDVRRTQIVERAGDVSLLDLIAEEDQAVTLSNSNYIKRTSMTEYRMQKRGGTGKRGMATRDEDFVRDLFIANTHGKLLIFTNLGRLYQLGVVEVPEGTATGKGRNLANLVNMPDGEKPARVLPIQAFSDGGDLLFISKKGMIKRTELADYARARSNGLNAVDIREGDELLTVTRTDREHDIMMLTRNGRAARFGGGSVRPMGRGARGVRGMNFNHRKMENDHVVDVVVIDAQPHLLTVTERGYGKRTPITAYSKKGRGGMGVRDVATDERNGPVVGAVAVDDADQLLLITDTGRLIRINVKEVRECGRGSKGVRLMRLDDGERVVAITRADAEDGEEITHIVEDPEDAAAADEVVEDDEDDGSDGGDEEAGDPASDT
ncbi:MAG: DNA gyrase subunit A [Myxococcales bacterium]|nr:DNA gyrase subunit A [Myxococcales bacterium]